LPGQQDSTLWDKLCFLLNQSALKMRDSTGGSLVKLTTVPSVASLAVLSRMHLVQSTEIHQNRELFDRRDWTGLK
jgi:hypothetical protein